LKEKEREEEGADDDGGWSSFFIGSGQSKGRRRRSEEGEGLALCREGEGTEVRSFDKKRKVKRRND
jgi:hypothetical protein